ncbi:MAG: thymidine phosphorylase [Deltaproteobacteria bacterium]|nr:MAG: thymidine phosphorylase [Deltaproteobacteria bacterium]
MSKKLAEGIDGLVLDVKVGSGAFMKRYEDARTLAETMVGIGRSMGKRTVAFLTCMDQPLGVAVGNALETEEAIEVLRGGGPADVRELTLTLGARMLSLAGAADSEHAARRKLEACLADASALARFRKMVALQGGDPAVVEDPRNVLPQARHEREYPASKAGFVQAIDTEAIGIAAALLGAGRMTMEDRIDPAVGLLVHKKIGDPVRKGEPLVTLRYNDEDRLTAALERLEGAYLLAPEPPSSIPLVFEVIEG